MKPVNFDSGTCNPISSNCVIWQGPNIDCINLCNGDTVSDVVYKLATELCTIMDTLNVSNYDLSCFNITACGPNDFTALIQFLIAKICELENITPTPEKSGGGCPTDCIVTVAECFQSSGLTMNLIDYVNMIATKICSIATYIDDVVKPTLADHESRLDVIETTYCKNCNFEIPSTLVDCDSLEDAGVITGEVQTVLSNFLNNVWCDIFDVLVASGNGSNLSTLTNAFNPDDIPSSTCDLSEFSSLGLSLSSATTLPQALANIWRILCALKEPVTLTAQNTPTIRTTLTGAPNYIISSKINDTGWVNLLGFSYMSTLASRPQCRRIGNQVIFRGVIQIPMGDASNGAAGNAINVNGPDFFRSSIYPYGKVLDAGLSTDPDACLMYSSGNPLVPSTSGGVNRDEGVQIYFNRGSRVIPSSIMDSTVDLDQTYTAGNRQIITRGINIGVVGTYLTTHINFAISDTGLLYLTSPYAVENFAGSYIDNSSILRSIVSNVISGENIPLYTNTAPSNSNAPGTVPYQVDLGGSATTWPFTVNCNNAYELGGFSVRLDGLFGYIDPCETEVVDYKACI